MRITHLSTTTDDGLGNWYWLEGIYDEDDGSLELTRALYHGETNMVGTLDEDAVGLFEYVLWDELHRDKENYDE